ncbi:MAG: HAMP domain-containing protein, partial [Caulobacteraceae bacterium]|nr:HAMP domain-containing protein [Caulobacter sp.]
MRLPAVLRTTPARLTLLFTALFAGVAAAFLAYIYIATAGEVARRADNEVARELASLQAVFARGGAPALNMELIQRTSGDRPYLYLLSDPTGKPITGNLAATPVEPATAEARAGFRVTETDPDGAVVKRQAWGRQTRLPNGELLFVGADIGEGRLFVARIVRALWGAGVLVVGLGLMGGLLVSRNVSRAMAGLRDAVGAVERGDLRARAPVRGVADEFDELAVGLNAMLDRVERLMGGLRHAGDAIAHDLRSPLTRMRARLEAALIDVEAGRAEPVPAMESALEDADGVLATFNAVLAITRLQAAGLIADGEVFDLGALARDVAELYGVLCEEKGLEFDSEIGANLLVRGRREFMAQALANLLDNAVKYTPAGGAVTLRVRRRSSGEVEASVTDTGPGVPEADRARVLQRFVRLENSRTEAGS